MKKFPLFILVLFAAVSLHAQTITATLDPSAIGYVSAIGQDGYVCGHSNTYCDGVPFVFPDSTQERAWIDTASNSHFIYWTADPLGLQGFTPDDGSGYNGARITSMDYTTPPTYHFAGTTTSGQPYTGTLSIVYRSFKTNGGGGKGGGGAGVIYVITAATMTITY